MTLLIDRLLLLPPLASLTLKRRDAASAGLDADGTQTMDSCTPLANSNAAMVRNGRNNE